VQALGTRSGGFRKKAAARVPNLFLAFLVSTADFGRRYPDFSLFARTSSLPASARPFPPFRFQDTQFLIPLKKIQLEILGLSSSQSQSGSFALILGEKGGNRRLPIIIGMFEAQSIAIQIEKISPNRPLTHDLFKSFAEHVHVVILEVVISDLKEGVFYSRIVCSDGATTFDIDARPSDAIAIGLRFGVPIYTVESVLSEAGIILSDLDEAESEAEEDEDDEDDDTDTNSPRASRAQPEPRDPSGQVSMEELSKMLSEALNREDYEKAAKIRDELNKRNG
jgi:bifunctional DNase/RNase